MIRKFKILGFYICISRAGFHVRPRKYIRRNVYRNSQRNLRLEMTDNRCEVCGATINKSCHLQRLLPAGAPDRNKVENIRVLCGKCWHELEKKPHIHAYHHLEDNTRYEN